MINVATITANKNVFTS